MASLSILHPVLLKIIMQIINFYEILNLVVLLCQFFQLLNTNNLFDDINIISLVKFHDNILLIYED